MPKQIKIHKFIRMGKTKVSMEEAGTENVLIKRETKECSVQFYVPRDLIFHFVAANKAWDSFDETTKEAMPG